MNEGMNQGMSIVQQVFETILYVFNKIKELFAELFPAKDNETPEA